MLPISFTIHGPFPQQKLAPPPPCRESLGTISGRDLRSSWKNISVIESNSLKAIKFAEFFVSSTRTILRVHFGIGYYLSLQKQGVFFPVFFLGQVVVLGISKVSTVLAKKNRHKNSILRQRLSPLNLDPKAETLIFFRFHLKDYNFMFLNIFLLGIYITAGQISSNSGVCFSHC